MGQKRIFSSLFLLCILLLQMTGCSGFPLPAKSEPVTLRFLYEENSADYPALAEEFRKEHPNITIQLSTYKDLGDFYRSYASKMGSADAARLFYGASLYYAEQIPDSLLALNPMLSTDADFPHSDLFPNLIDNLRVEGKLIGLPAGINPFVIFVNAEKFQAAGQPLPQPGWTVDDFVQAAQAVHQTDDSGRGTYGFCTHPESSDASIFLRVFGGDVVDDIRKPTGPVLDQPANEAALHWYASLFNEFHVTLPLNQTQQTAAQIQAGNCAMWMDVLSGGNYGLPADVEATPLPLPVSAAPMTFAAPDTYVIRTASEHPDEAWQWIRFLMEHEQASGKILPALRSQIQSDAFQASVPPAVSAIARGLPERIEFGSGQHDPRLLQANMQYYLAVQRVLKGEQDAKTALEQAQQEALKAWEK